MSLLREFHSPESETSLNSKHTCVQFLLRNGGTAIRCHKLPESLEGGNGIVIKEEVVQRAK